MSVALAFSVGNKMFLFEQCSEVFVILTDIMKVVVTVAE